MVETVAIEPYKWSIQKKMGRDEGERRFYKLFLSIRSRVLVTTDIGSIATDTARGHS